ncbi:MAG: 2-C-methyl-D-erythritol 4-phosphate cytidylyltransferase, partial [Candidatus Omnitrophica bacterium]|nr:2-C-methyl-D-erythritol 4-phosphate cytidylyltransferase [Candidatus Omnitrophota bacterium]
LIHDAARPFAGNKLVSSLIKASRAYGAAIAGVPVKATIKKIRGGNKKIKAVEKTIERNTLWEIQTPQVFKKDLILKAYEKFGNIGVTDDAMLVEKLKKSVRVVLGAYNNIKITTPEDLMIARAIAKGL